LEPRTTTLPVTFRVGSLRALGPPGSERGWVAADRRGRHYELTIGDVEDTKMTARIRHGDGDRRLLAYADLAPFVEALFDQLAALLERPVFACCDSPQPDPAGTCQACGAELTDDQLRALVGCTHPTVADIPAGERSLNSTRFVGQVVGLSGSRRGVPTTGSEGTGESSIYRYECCRSQRMATAPQIGGR
jgi:hypothetical protein